MSFAVLPAKCAGSVVIRQSAPPTVCTWAAAPPAEKDFGAAGLVPVVNTHILTAEFAERPEHRGQEL